MVGLLAWSLVATAQVCIRLLPFSDEITFLVGPAQQVAGWEMATLSGDWRGFDGNNTVTLSMSITTGPGGAITGGVWNAEFVGEFLPFQVDGTRGLYGHGGGEPSGRYQGLWHAELSLFGGPGVEAMTRRASWDLQAMVIARRAAPQS
jgi:hypothetical protein